MVRRKRPHQPCLRISLRTSLWIIRSNSFWLSVACNMLNDPNSNTLPRVEAISILMWNDPSPVINSHASQELGFCIPCCHIQGSGLNVPIDALQSPCLNECLNVLSYSSYLVSHQSFSLCHFTTDDLAQEVGPDDSSSNMLPPAHLGKLVN